MDCKIWKQKLHNFGSKNAKHVKSSAAKLWDRWSRAQDEIRLILWNWPVLLLFGLSCKVLLWSAMRMGVLLFVLCFPFLTYIEVTGMILYFDDGIKGRRTGTLRLWRQGIVGLCRREGENLFRLLCPAAPFFLPLFLLDLVFLAPEKLIVPALVLFLSAAVLCALFWQSCDTKLCSLPGMVCSGYSSFWAGKESERLLCGKGARTFLSLIGWILAAVSGALLFRSLYGAGVLILKVIFDYSAVSFVSVVSPANCLFRVLLSVYFTLCASAFSFQIYETYRSEEIDQMYRQDVEVLQVYREYQRRVEELLREQWRRADDCRSGAFLRNFFFKNY